VTKHPVIFIRHGETDWNREVRFQGQQDIPLNATGRRQAERNGRALKGILAERPWRIVASPLGRTMETLRIALAAAGQPLAPFTTDRTLMEACFGDWEGLTLREIERDHPAMLREREADKWGFVPPAGESYAALTERVSGWAAKLDAPTLVVSHGGVLRALLHLLGGLPSHDAPHLAAPQDRVILFTPKAVLTI
jgi:broad specificity phosphatase PhoE